jgi:phosphohistidine phosphatase
VKILICRHGESESGPREDPTRELTSTGKAQARLVGRWLKHQTTKPEVVIESNMKRSRQTAKRIADRLGVDRLQATRGLLDPDADPEQAWEEIIRIGKEAGAECVIAVTHGPLVQELVAMMTGASPALVHFPHGAVAQIDSETDILHWLVTPSVIARDEGEAVLVQPRPEVTALEAELTAAAEDLAELLEARGAYYYEEVTLKRWVLGPGGRSGNCEDCIENSDEGEIEESDFFPGGDEPVDEPPQHPNCECSVVYRDTVRRVYA